MIDGLGWMLAALVAVAALVVGWLRSSGAGGRGPCAPGAQGAFPPTDPEGVEARTEVVEATGADIEGVWTGLDGDDPEGAISTAANEARARR